MSELDPERVHALGQSLLRDVRQHYLSAEGAPSKGLVFEVLNALAFAVGTTLAGTGNNAHARDFFNQAVDETIEALKDD